MLMASRWILTKPQSTGDQVCQDPAAHIERLHDHSMASRVNQGHHLCLLPAASKRMHRILPLTDHAPSSCSN